MSIPRVGVKQPAAPVLLLKQLASGLVKEQKLVALVPALGVPLYRELLFKHVETNG